MSQTPPGFVAMGWVRLQRWLPGVPMLLGYQRHWLMNDVVAGLVLTAVLIPVRHGLRRGLRCSGHTWPVCHHCSPDCLCPPWPQPHHGAGAGFTLAAVIAALILPLAQGSVERAVALSAMLALLSGGFLMLIALARLGIMADLFSKPIRIGFLNAIALTVMVGQLPKVLGFSVKGDGLIDKVVLMIQGVAQGRVNAVALGIGASSLALILLCGIGARYGQGCCWRLLWPRRCRPGLTGDRPRILLYWARCPRVCRP
jgi:hypothetical protein